MRSTSGTSRSGSRTRALFFALLLLVAPASPALSSRSTLDATRLTVEEALQLAFPGAQIEKSTAYLTDAQKLRVEKLAGETLDSAIARPYAAKKAGKPLPGTHSPQWAPDLKPTLTNTIKAETAILLDLMAPQR